MAEAAGSPEHDQHEQQQQQQEPRAKRPHEVFRLVQIAGQVVLRCRRCGGRAFVEREIDYDGCERIELSEYSCVRCGQRAYATQPAPRQREHTGK